MATETAANPEEAVKAASAHLYQAMTHHYGPLGLGAHQPLVKAISEYAQRCRENDEAGQAAASKHITEALTSHFGPRDLGADDPVTRAIAEYGAACRKAGRAA